MSGGETPLRSFRAGAEWDEAQRIAKLQGDNISVMLRDRLREYIEDNQGDGTMSGIYYRVIARSGHVVALQDFDERDYDPRIWLTDYHGNPLAFRTEKEATYVAQVRCTGMVQR